MEFSLKQLSWIVISALGLGGTGYMSTNSKIDDLDKRLAVVISQLDNQIKFLERIEQKVSIIKWKRSLLLYLASIFLNLS